jgi:positive regulator of sigma E activity
VNYVKYKQKAGDRDLFFSHITLAGLLGIILLVTGAIYRYRVKKYQLDQGNFLNLIGSSFVTALAVVYMFGSIDFFFYKAVILGFDVDDLKIAALVGSLIFGYLAVHRFADFLRNNGRNSG